MLVKKNNDGERQSEQANNLKTKEMILEQKKLRLNSTYAQHEKEIREI
jgi:hypothetical protein